MDLKRGGAFYKVDIQCGEWEGVRYKANSRNALKMFMPIGNEVLSLAHVEDWNSPPTGTSD